MILEKNCLDEVLFKRISEDDQTAFKDIFDRYKSRFYATAFKMTHSADQSEEIVQDTFVSIWTSRKALEKVENPAGYLYTILYNQIYARFKKIAADRLMKTTLQKLPEAVEYSVAEKYNEKEANQFIEKLIRKLPTRQQEVYILSKQEGLSRNEIAKKLELSPHTVKNHLLEAVKFLRTNFYKTSDSLLLFFAGLLKSLFYL